MRTFELKNAIIREVEPSYRTFNFLGTRYRLFVPYMLFVTRTDLRVMLLAMRATPLENKLLTKQMVLFPPLPHVYSREMICCSEATPEGFFAGISNLSEMWMGVSLALKLFPGKVSAKYKGARDSYREWTCKTPDEVMEVFKNYPKEMDGYITPGCWYYNNHNGKRVAVQYPLKNMLGPLLHEAVSHVRDVNELR